MMTANRNAWLLLFFFFIYSMYLMNLRPYPFYEHMYLSWNTFDQFSWLSGLQRLVSLFFVTLYFGYLLRKAELQALFHKGFFVFIILLLPVIHSLFFSLEPLASASICANYIGIYLFAFCIRAKYPVDDVLHPLHLLAKCVAILNVIALFFPSISFMLAEHEGRFRGFFLHKNNLGFSCLLLLIVSVYERHRCNKSIISMTPCVLLISILMSGQAAAIFLGSLALVVWVVMTTSVSKRYSLVASHGAWIVACIWIIALIFDFTSADVLDILGRDATLTGRNKIWSFFLSLASQRFFSGYGFQAVFLDTRVLGQLADAGLGFRLGTAHSSYI